MGNAEGSSDLLSGSAFGQLLQDLALPTRAT
jgi:hypothetical protein